MLGLRLFIDEVGDFGAYKSHVPVFHITFVLHDLSKSLVGPIEHLQRNVVERGLPMDHAIHTGPLIWHEGGV